MDSVTLIVLIGIGILAIILLLLLRTLSKRKKQAAGKADYMLINSHKLAKKRNYLEGLYRFFRAAPVFNRYFGKVNSKVKMQFPSDPASINRKTTLILAKGTIIGGVCLVCAISISGGDAFFMCAGILLSYIVLTSAVNSGVNSLELKLLTQFSEAISKIRHYYHDLGIVEDSLSLAIDEVPYEIGLHLYKLHDIIIDPAMSIRIDQYIGTEPNKYMLMFLQICASIKDFGDKKLEDGTSLFLTDINYLKEEINNDIIATKKNNAKFASLPAFAIIPVLAIKLIEAWAKTNMPEISAFYGGLYGMVAMVLIFITALVSHELIVTLRDGGEEVEKDSSIWAKVADHPLISSYLIKIVNKNYTKYARYDDDMKGMGDRTGPKAFLLKRLTMFAAGALAVILLFTVADVTQRIKYVNDFNDAFAESMAPDDEYRENMESVSRMYTRYYKSNRAISEQELKKQILEEDNGIKNEVLAEEMASKIAQRISKRLNTYFKWYYLIIALAVGYFAYNAPVLLLKFKKNLIEMRKEEEIIQFQSIMLILMHINGTTLPIILEWMERFAYCFKESIMECRLNLNSGSQQALKDMKNREVFGPFKDFIDNLLSIDNVGVEKAFDEIQTDREYYKKKRELDRDINIEKKAKWANTIVMAPMLTLIIFYLIVPMVMYAFSMLSTFTTMVGSI